nr:unnamed protein product [Naegleria fowleri]
MNTSTTTRTRSLYALPTRSQLIAQLKQFQQQPHHKKSNLNNINLNNINLNSINLNNSNPSQVNLNNSNPSQVNPNNSNMSNPNQHPLFDVIVIGGGCVGSGIALEASHSLKVALFEMEDFGSGTSSKSTKLLHGGVRYLRKALNQFDLSQFKLVKQALHDRFQILNHMAPHLTNTLQIITPLYEWSEFIPTYFLLKLYDWMAFPHHLAPSYLLSASQALEFFPMLKHEQLKGAMVYHDGQFDDARLNLALIQTAIQHGVVALNRFKVIRFLFNDEHGENDEHVRQQDDSQQQEHVRQQDDSQQQEHDDEHDDSQHNGPSSLIKGVVVRDELTREVYSIRSKVVINAAGHFADEIRLMENDQNHHHHQNHHPLNTLNTLNNKILELSMGIHIVLDGQFCPPSMHQGLLIPKTRDHRVIFLLPYLNHTLVGTTDSKLVVDSFNKNGISNHVQPREEDIQYLLDHVNEYFNVKVTRQDVKAVWAGIRPLSHLHNNNHNHNNNNHNQQQQQQFVKKNIKLDTASISREHAIYTSPRNCTFNTCTHPHTTTTTCTTTTTTCTTHTLQLYGSEEYNSTFDRVLNEFIKELDISQHLNHAYGDQGYLVQKIALEEQLLKRLDPHYPYIEAEVVYSVRYEYALKISDIIQRRTRLFFIDTKVSKQVIPRVSQLMAKELGWSEEERLKQVEECLKELFLSQQQQDS